MPDHGPAKRPLVSQCLSIRAWPATAALAAVLAGGQAAEALGPSLNEDRFLPWEKGSIKAGGFIAAFDNSLGFGINNAAGVAINAEEVFGLDTSLTVFRGEVMFRPGKSLRHQLDFSYAAYHRAGNATLSQEIEISSTVDVRFTGLLLYGKVVF